MKRKKNMSRKKKPSKSLYADRNRAVAESRGEDWRKKLLKGATKRHGGLNSLKRARLKKSLSQSALASKIGIHLSTYGNVERKAIEATPEMASKIARSLGTDRKNLFKKLKSSNYAVR